MISDVEMAVGPEHQPGGLVEVPDAAGGDKYVDEGAGGPMNATSETLDLRSRVRGRLAVMTGEVVPGGMVLVKLPDEVSPPSEVVGLRTTHISLRRARVSR